MTQDIFSDEDKQQIIKYGFTMEDVSRQLDLFNMPAPYLKLVRACIKGYGIKVVEAEQMKILIDAYDHEIPNRRCLKFVPASGAASRMFKSLLGALGKEEEILKESVEKEALSGQKDGQELLKFIHGIEKFAFFEDLKTVMAENGLKINSLVEKGRFTDIIRSLLLESGLNYANLPKGLLKFHEYEDKSRTAFEEHMVEAVSYSMDKDNQCHLHFTISPEHMEKFKSLLKTISPLYEKKFGASFHVTFSVQKNSTDTIAVDPDNRPFRDEGSLLFRPGGHGALIENVNDLKGDIIFIKNIDNIVPDRFKDDTYKWKKVLGGYLITLQNRIFSYLKKLTSGTVDDLFIDDVLAFIADEFFLQPPDFIKTGIIEDKQAFLIERLDRPLRICGMVKNEGEPGGGPFWVQDNDGTASPQIVESVQIDSSSPEQQDILASSTHFNPVDLVCGVSDWKGKPFDLHKYVDNNAVFISQKLKDGKDLKALEHPGLWNGAMARWLTLFVEVPIITFNPVKTVNDLLRDEHQPG